LPPSTPLAPTVEREPPSQPRDTSPAARVLSRDERAEREERLVRLTMGGMAAGLGLALVLSGLMVGLVVGLRGVSTDAAEPAAVAVALVLTRGLIVVGMLAFGCGLIFFATRLLLARGVVAGR
jgi:predicted lipid-binding transport protein (Tim44 family)